MKTLLGSFILLLSFSTLQAHSPENDPILIPVDNGFVMAEHRIKGPVNLFVHSFLKQDFIDTGLRVVAAGTIKEERYFLGVEGNVIEITPANYKKKIKKYLPNAPALHKRLGRPGFRFENLNSMIKFYNDFRVPAKIAYTENRS